jgi:hypothetical protein
MEEYGVLGIVVEVVFVWDKTISGPGQLGGTFTRYHDRQKGEGGCTSACLPR